MTAQPPTVQLNAESVRQAALDAGFTEAALRPLPHHDTVRDAARFEQFVAKQRHGTMAYLERRDAEGRLLRGRVDVPFPWARSVLVCLAGYGGETPLSIAPAEAGSGWIARYAITGRPTREHDPKLDPEPGAASCPAPDHKAVELRPSDYHKVLLRRMRAVESRLKAEHGGFESRAYVDTGPLVERSVARAAGLGWVGKNTCLIHPRLGSWNFLAVLVMEAAVSEQPQPLTVPDRCGSCTRCIDACPTGALSGDYRMDARRCISYLTIEHKGALDETLMSGMGRQVFGCDICQDVCPWNHRAPVARDEEMAPRQALVNPALGWLAALDEADYERLFNGSPVRRAGFNGLRRNLAVAMGNSGLAEYRPLLRKWAADEERDTSVRAAARWAVATLTASAKSHRD